MKLKYLFFLSLLGCTQISYAQKCVNIYFDKTTDSQYWMGKTYATLTQNLIGHFPDYQQIVSPIEMYQSGDLNKCKANIYIGSYFNNAIPQSFLKEVKTTKNNVAWLGYNIWLLDNFLEIKTGYKYTQMSELDNKNLDNKDRPSFLKNIHYKGEIFFKYGEWSPFTPNLFNAPFEQSLLEKTKDVGTTVLAEAVNPVTSHRAPYVIRNKNFFYFTDVPLSYMHEADRYLVYTDILFDILDEKPRHNGKYAFMRIEDVHPLVNLGWLYRTNEVLLRENVQINISLIPIFFDPSNNYDRLPNQEILAMDQYRPFMSWVDDVKKAQGNFIWHGVTHQYSRMNNPHSGTSGDDFEFFDAVNNKPIPEDSVDYVLAKLEDGLSILKKSEVVPRIWLMPHYQASPLDYIIFGSTFSWNVGRVIYYNFDYKGIDTSKDLKNLWYESQHKNGAELRKNYFKNLTINYQADIWSGQMFPYEIHGDVHGQRIIPENLGNSQPFVNAHVVSPRTKEDIIADAKRNLVIRDAWASLFYHPFLFSSYEEGGRGTYPGDPAELEYIIRNIKKLGYKFIDINEFMDKNTINKRPEPIYKDTNL